jgi:DNA uptake protein ComE-like DNA-binding protein
MKVTLTEDKGWKGQVYLKGDREIPEDLAIALGLLQLESGVPDSEVQADHWLDLMAAINQATDPKDLEPLPTIGKGAAKQILANRPEAGYSNLDQVRSLNPELGRAPYRVDWAKIEQYAKSADVADLEG